MFDPLPIAKFSSHLLCKPINPLMAKLQKKLIFDNIHGHITLNRVEARILETPYYQRLRWIRQLGFSFYIFPGATHTRHAHALGVLHTMDKILKSIGLAVPEEKLFNPRVQDENHLSPNHAACSHVARHRHLSFFAHH